MVPIDKQLVYLSELQKIEGEGVI
uniref:Uncharacterized protein n=1 Tax=Arundo donax TaxID=35708 RepID=A0A0A9AJT7_ARUDO